MTTGFARLFVVSLSVMLAASCGRGVEAPQPIPEPVAAAEAGSSAKPIKTPTPAKGQAQAPNTPEPTRVAASGTPPPSATPVPVQAPRDRPTPTGTPAQSQTPTPTTPAPAPTATSAPVAAAGRTASPPAAVSATRLASHLFIPVGESRSIAGLGRLLEAVFLTEPASVDVDGDLLTATVGGMACLRFEYREGDAESDVQTLCSVSFDEDGDCSGSSPLDLDLQRFLGPAGGPEGNADLLESGDGLLYASCKTATGAYRLQRPGRPLPRLYFTVVDALGEGPYSLGSAEFRRQRTGVVTTYSGRELTPPWILSVSLEVDDIRVTEHLQVAFTWEDCSISPGCTLDPTVVEPGDMVRISTGIPSELLETAFDAMSEPLRDRFFADRIGIGWTEIVEVHPDAAGVAFNRLVALDMMTHAVRYFDGIYDLADSGVTVGYLQPWQAQSPLAFPHECFPDSIAPGETERCGRIDEAIQALEARRIGELQADGLELWYAGSIDYDGEGQYVHISDRRPDFSIFEGAVVGVGANSGAQVEHIPTTLAAVTRQFASEIGADTPVVLSLNGPPITAQTGGAFCEAQICPSDFGGMYEQAEAVLDAATRSLDRDQFVGFGVSLFDGSHFDIRDPYEEFEGFSLNRVGETGYNNPILNVYRAMPAKSPTPTNVSTAPEPTGSTADAEDGNACGNAVGNGNEVIPGPSAPAAKDRDSVFRSLAVHPTDPDIVLIGTERNGFVKSTDGGMTWTRHRLGLRWQPGTGYPEVYDVAISPSDPNIVLAATVGSPGPVIGDFPSAIAGMYKSTDGGETWVRKNCGLASSRVVAVRFDPTDADHAIATIGAGERSFSTSAELPTFFDGGIYVTSDGGDNWKRSPGGDKDTLNDFHTVVATNSNSPALITFGLHTFQRGPFDPSLSVGFLRSVDGGETWRSFGTLDVGQSKITHFDASTDGEVIYATVTDSYHHWISTDAGLTWTKSSLNQGSDPVAVSPSDPRTVIFRDSVQTSLYRSTDGLQTYKKVVTTVGSSDDPDIRFAFEDIVFAPSDPSIVYAATTGLLVYKSIDGGESFTMMKNIRSEVLNAQL